MALAKNNRKELLCRSPFHLSDRIKALKKPDKDMSQGTHDWILAVARSLQEALGHADRDHNSSKNR